jgi:hypothetical protein
VTFAFAKWPARIRHRVNFLFRYNPFRVTQEEKKPQRARQSNSSAASHGCSPSEVRPFRCSLLLDFSSGVVRPLSLRRCWQMGLYCRMVSDRGDAGCSGPHLLAANHVGSMETGTRGSFMFLASCGVSLFECPRQAPSKFHIHCARRLVHRWPMGFHSQSQRRENQLNSFQLLMPLGDVNPKGRGSIFAKQIVWRPFSPLNSHFSAELTWRDGSVHEDIRIANVAGKWFYKIGVSDKEQGTALLFCRDSGFPSSEPWPRCFPDFIQQTE